jgi:two-component system response regulator MprA
VKVLLVENSPILREALQRGLRRNGHETTVVAARDWTLVAEHACEHDVVVIDFEPPAVDGKAVLSEIRARCPTLPVLLLAFHDGIYDLVHDGDECLIKPFAFDDLLVRIRLLGRSRPRS